MSRQIYVNLPIRNMERSKAFFSALGFSFNPQFTNEQGACMVISEDHNFVMLLVEPFFKTFTPNAICDAKKSTEAIVCLSCDSRAEVDDLVNRAIAAGGKHAMEPQDHGFMYGWSFYDPDGHHWEVFWMDPQAAQS